MAAQAVRRCESALLSLARHVKLAEARQAASHILQLALDLPLPSSMVHGLGVGGPLLQRC